MILMCRAPPGSTRFPSPSLFRSLRPQLKRDPLGGAQARSPLMGPINLSRAALPAAVLFIFLSIPALAQDTQARSKPRFHGFALKVHGVKTSPWTWTRFGGAFQARQAGGLRLNVSYAPVPSLAAYVAADPLPLTYQHLTD